MLDSPIQVYEIGAGAGACAASILDHVKSAAPPAVYHSCQYRSAAPSAELVASFAPYRDSPRFRRAIMKLRPQWWFEATVVAIPS